MNRFPYFDPYIPYRGTCAFCGDTDARHRVIDAIVERLYQWKEPLEEIASDLGLPLESIKAVKNNEPASLNAFQNDDRPKMIG